MGLTVYAYPRVIKEPLIRVNEGVDVEESDIIDPMRFYFIPHPAAGYPLHHQGIEIGVVHSSSQMRRVCSTSCTNYGAWRDELSKLSREIIHETGAPNSKAPFSELIHFTDNCGTINTAYANKLAREFREYAHLASEKETQFNLLYRSFMEGFEIAAASGMMVFV